MLKRFTRRGRNEERKKEGPNNGEEAGVAEAFNERQESEAGGNRENNKKWTERKEPAGVVA